MSHRSDALAAMRGERPQRVPFIGRMNLWYNYHSARGTLPERYAGLSYFDVVRDLGIGILGFGVWTQTFFRKTYRGLEVSRYAHDGDDVLEYTTPYGTLRQRTAVSDVLRGTVDAGRDVEVLFKDQRDYDALQYLVEHTGVEETYDSYARYVDEIGEDGVALPYTGWAPMHELMWKYMGVERFYYELCDRPAKVERLHQSFRELHLKIVRLAAHCPAQAIQVGGNYDDSITPPKFWDAYVAPFYREVVEALRPSGKLLVIHGDGKMVGLLSRIRDAGIQVAEALTPWPSTPMRVAEMRALWRDSVCMWGLVPFIIFTPVYSEEQFRAYVEDLYRVMAPGERFILGFGDNLPPEALLARVQWLVRFNEEHGSYPVRV